MQTRSAAAILGLLGLLTIGCGAGLDAEDTLTLDLQDTHQALRAVIHDGTPVTQVSCESTKTISFARLTHFEQRTLLQTANLFNAYQAGPVTPAAGCQVQPGSASCSAFGYVCWIQVLPGAEGEPNILDYGCGKETC